MKLVFEDRITEAGRTAIQDLIDLVVKDVDRAIETHGENHPEACRSLLVLISIEQIMEPCEVAHGNSGDTILNW